MPGPAHFLDSILDDLSDRTAVVAGIPRTVPSGAVAVEVAEMVRQRRLGRWTPIRSGEAETVAPAAAVARSVAGNGDDPVFWVDTTRSDGATDSWTDHVRRLADDPRMPRLCIVADAVSAQACIEDKRLRRRVWSDFVTGLDTRALAQRLARHQGRSDAHMELRGAVIAELAGDDLTVAERLSHEPLGRMLDDRECPRDRVWAAQVAVLFPVIERERQRLVDAHRNMWQLPHTRPDGSEIVTLEELEIGDLAAQLARIGSLSRERRRAEWLRRVRNDLAHNRTVSWSTLTSPAAIQIIDFRD